MHKNNLKQKINKVKWWAIGFTLAYLIVGAFLVSDYPLSKSIFDPRKTYDLIKDALTLTAYFLAPVAAFILFSDWREQHTAVKIEAEAEKIVKTILQINADIDSMDLDVRKNFTEIKIQNFEIRIEALRLRLTALNTDMAVIFDGVPKAEGFNNYVSDLLYEMLNYLNLMRIAIESKNNINTNQNEKVKEFYKDKEALYLNKSFERFTKYSELLSKIGESIQELKINGF